MKVARLSTTARPEPARQYAIMTAFFGVWLFTRGEGLIGSLSTVSLASSKWGLPQPCNLLPRSVRLAALPVAELTRRVLGIRPFQPTHPRRVFAFSRDA